MAGNPGQTTETQVLSIPPPNFIIQCGSQPKHMIWKNQQAMCGAVSIIMKVLSVSAKLFHIIIVISMDKLILY